MSDLLLKEKTTKKAFNRKMVETFGFENLYTSLYNEDGQSITLYYVEGADRGFDGSKGPLHVGSWSKGRGWIFSHAKKCIITNYPNNYPSDQL